MLGTGSVVGLSPLFCRTARTFSLQSGWKCCGNSVAGGILVFPLLLTPRPGSAEAQPSAHCVRVSFYKPEFSFFLLPPPPFFFSVLIALA